MVFLRHGRRDEAGVGMVRLFHCLERNMEAVCISGVDSKTGNPMLLVNFSPDEGGCLGQVVACDCAELDTTLDEEIYEMLLNNRYGTSNKDLPMESIPETGGLCYQDWFFRVLHNWERYTPDQQ